jgi:predicted metal-dependent phosphoesterase TrpH
MVEKGYVANLRQAFDDYLDESAKGYVFRREPQFAEGVARIRAAGGIASLAHPVRVKGDIAALMPELCASGLNAIEAYHSDHSPRTPNSTSGWPAGMACASPAAAITTGPSSPT